MWEILPRLPVKTLCRFRCVSKSWYRLLSDPNFLQLHWKRSKQNPRLLVITPDYDANRIPFFTMKMNHEHDGKIRVAADLGFDVRPLHKNVSACHGLVLMYNRYTIRIWNPATGDRIDIDAPPPILTGNNNSAANVMLANLFGEDNLSKDIVAAIGYVESTGEYKLLISHTGYKMSWQVLTIGSGRGWRATKNPPTSGTCNIAAVNGFIHVLLSDIGIARFDLEKEDWSVIPIADLAPGYKYYDLLLKEVNGFLCLVQFSERRCRTDIWFLKDYGEGNWVKEYTIDNSYMMRRRVVEPLMIKEDGRILFANRNLNLLFYYDPKSESFQNFYKVEQKKCPIMLSTLYAETFASLKRGKIGRIGRCPAV